MSRVLAWTATRAIPSIFHPVLSSANLLGNNFPVATARPGSPLVLKCALSTTGGADRMGFRVATYNILCSHLAEPSRFPLCSPKDLDAPTRLERVKHKLDSEVSQGSVICLQEVSIQWAGDLHVYFLARGYAFVTANYGGFFNNYMGVALAWPLDKYEAITVDIARVSDTRKWGREPRQDGDQRQASDAAKDEWLGPLGLLRKLAGRGTKRPRETNEGAIKSRDMEPEDPWRLGKRRFNQTLFARLRPKDDPSSSSAPNGGTFCVGTYHMPCLFNVRPVMVMHTSMVIKHLVSLAGSDPLVFAGDFNFNPDSECYKLATEGDLPSSSPDFPMRPEWEKDWSAITGARLVSAYKQVNGEEPNFTNHAKVEDYEPFIDTLDYIFHTEGVTATQVLPLKHRDEVKGPFPIADEPSDHVVLAAEYEFDATAGDA